MDKLCGCLFGSNKNEDVPPRTRSSRSLTNSFSMRRFSRQRFSNTFRGTESFKEMPTWVGNLRPELKAKIRRWLISFHHLDPRYQILTFFNLVATHGGDDLCNDMDDNDNCVDVSYKNEDEIGSSEELDLISQYSLKTGKRKSSVYDFLVRIFNTTSILTVWRPTSNDSMRRMMMGEGVGKGLNIKGKSAKKGELSAYVPFMQIHRELDKQLVQKISKKARLRIYYSSEEFRQSAIDILSNKECETIQEDTENDIDIDIKILDDFGEECGMYGMEVQQSLFWKAYVLDQDISRDNDTETGRPSTPGFQDGNLKTLKQACATKPAPDPFPVIIQLSKDNPMSPQHLVMGYEEHGFVKPVVSDFDGFLMGWRREALWFGCNLPNEQEELMLWSLKQIQRILEEPSCETWTIRWLSILKEEAAKGGENIPEMPQYGYGDPKSYSIMEKAAKRLSATGAVRHGSECFNYEFPQEIDDHFLLISDTFHPVPWKYVSIDELQEILIEKIEEGFVFPLNPKWILCDPGWKRVYDALMESRALYADMSRDVWFPRYSGIREQIDQLHEKYPNGFQQQRPTLDDVKRMSVKLGANENYDSKSVRLSGKDANTLARLELENFRVQVVDGDFDNGSSECLKIIDGEDEEKESSLNNGL